MRISTRNIGNIIPAVRPNCCRVTLNKKSGNQHKIPYSMTCTYVHPPVDNVRPEFQVDVPDEVTSDVMEIKTVDEAIEVYLQAFQQKFLSREGRRHRKRSLEMFLQHLITQDHSLKLEDLTPADGQGFLQSLTNYYDGQPPKAVSKTKHWNAIRSFTRFLHQIGLLKENIFLSLKKT